MKVLIISSTTWDNSNSFGNTFSNLFGGMENIEIYNIACRHGTANNSIVKDALQLTDRSVLKSIYKCKFDPCIESSIDNTDKNLNVEISQTARKKRKLSSFILRDMIWKLGRWKKSKRLKDFLERTKPDAIYLPIYASPYICDVQKYIIKKLGVPVIGHISDDVYSYPPKISLFGKLYRARLRKKIRAIISTCSYLEVFAENMQKKYATIFNKNCYLIGKGVQESVIEQTCVDAPRDKPYHFVYTGNIGDERYKSLYDIGIAITEIFKECGAILDVYTATPLTSEMKSLIDSCSAIKFHGEISREEVDTVQKNADFLVHVEGFTSHAIFSAKMSFSTKIIDYMTMKKPILAYGSEEINSIQVLKRHEVALTAISYVELKELIKNIAFNKVDYSCLTKKTKEYLSKYRNIKNIQAGIYNRMAKLVNKNESTTN